MPRFPLALAFLLLPVATSPSVAQQREPRIEVYGLSGVYSTGIEWAPFTPQTGAGVLLPIGSKWAALVDASVGATRVDDLGLYRNDPRDESYVFYQRNPHLVDEDEHFSRAATLRPSIVRIWRQQRISFWVGAGLGLEWEHNRGRVRRIRDALDDDGNVIWRSEDDVFPVLVRDENFHTWDRWSDRPVLIGDFGASVELAPRIVFRLGYSCLMSDPDSSLAGAVEMGIGYRF